MVMFFFNEIVAYNGHTDCVRQLLQHLDDENGIDCVDDQGR